MPSSSVIQLGDLALLWSNSEGNADLAILDLDLATDRGMETAIALSLYTDRRAQKDDVPPSGDARDRRGWWADQFAAIANDLIGSRAWLLDRAKLTAETKLGAKQYATEALAWLIEDKVVAGIGIDVETTANGLIYAVTPQRPGRDAVTYRFAHVWEHVEEDT